MGIKSIIPSQILNSRGEPTLKVKMTAENGTSAWFIVPAGASIGSGEAQKRVDENGSYGGNGVTACIDLINNVIAPKFIGYPTEHQDDFDSLLIALDGSENKENLGANTVLALSGAYFKLSAKLSKKPLWQYIAESYNYNPEFPRIYATIVGGGKHAPGLDIQEFLIIPKSNQPIESIELISDVYHTLQNIMISLYGPTAKLVGDEGALAPVGARTEVVLEAFTNLSAKLGNPFDIALDVAANSFFDGQTYHFEGQNIHASDLLATYEDWNSKFNLYSIEDPFAENDLEGLELLKTIPKDKKPYLIVADDYTVTNATRITQFAQDQLFDGVIIKPDQVGSITEMFAAIDATRQAGSEVIVSHRSGESNDDFIVDLAYGIGAFGIKIGAPCRGERIAKYNRLLEIQYAQDALQTKLGPIDDTVRPIETPQDRPGAKSSTTTPQQAPNNASAPIQQPQASNQRPVPGSVNDISFGRPSGAPIGTMADKAMGTTTNGRNNAPAPATNNNTRNNPSSTPTPPANNTHNANNPAPVLAQSPLGAPSSTMPGPATPSPISASTPSPAGPSPIANTTQPPIAGPTPPPSTNPNPAPPSGTIQANTGAPTAPAPQPPGHTNTPSKDLDSGIAPLAPM